MLREGGFVSRSTGYKGVCVREDRKNHIAASLLAFVLCPSVSSPSPPRSSVRRTGRKLVCGRRRWRNGMDPGAQSGPPDRQGHGRSSARRPVSGSTHSSRTEPDVSIPIAGKEDATRTKKVLLLHTVVEKYSSPTLTCPTQRECGRRPSTGCEGIEESTRGSNNRDGVQFSRYPFSG